MTHHSPGRYLEFELDPATLTKVAKLAAKRAITPFEMCAILLRERTARRTAKISGKLAAAN